MIEVRVTEVCNSEFDEELYKFDAKFMSNEDTPARGVVEMFAQAMRTSGYMEKSVLEAMYDYALEYANANGIDIREKL